ncbi:MAG: phosphate acyltransferase, partial [Deltaproteobacteria bacterium]|nr:phosphate acyltransferase [Deltaproteobacteria bacterium]
MRTQYSPKTEGFQFMGGAVETLQELKKIIPNHPFEIVHASSVVSMEDSVSSVRTNKDASINVAFRLLKEKKVDAVVSPGHSGAFMASALLNVGRLPGIVRPALTAKIPTISGEVIMLDIGANVDCRPEYLVQWARMGATYCKTVIGVPNPRIGLLSNASEEGKGTEMLRQVHELL